MSIEEKKEFEPTTAVYTPQTASQYGLEAIRRVRENKMRGANMFLPGDISEYFAPLLPGQVCVIQAQTSNYKSGFIHAWERGLAHQLMEDGRDDEAIIHVSVEENVEEQVFLELGRETGDETGKLARGEVQDWSKLEAAAIKIGTIPIYRIGDSLARGEDLPDLYISNMVRAIFTLTRGKITPDPIKPAAIFFDYLQAFPIDPEVKRASFEEQRRLQVREDFFRIRQAAYYFNCPVFVAAQSKQSLGGPKDKKALQLPGIYDIEESSSVAQRADRIISLCLPARSNEVGEWISIKGKSLQVTNNMLIMKISKQRGGLPAGESWIMEVDFKRNSLKPWGSQNAQRPGAK